MHKLNVILIISMAFVLAASCVALAGKSLNFGKTQQTYVPQKPDGTATKRTNNPTRGSGGPVHPGWNVNSNKKQ